MDSRKKEQLKEAVKTFYLPSYREIPNVGLYLEQTTMYIMEYLKPLGDISITGSMISNYVKKGLVENPVRKMYNRDQIAKLIFIAVAKSVFSLENIQILLNLQKESCDSAVAYDYFVEQMRLVLNRVFELDEEQEEREERKEENGLLDERQILQNLVITVAHKIYLDQCFALLGGETEK